jgi:hypothetical protein
VDEKRAKHLLGKIIRPDGSLYNLPNPWEDDYLCSYCYIHWELGTEELVLEGNFTPLLVEAMVWWIKNHGQGVLLSERRSLMHTISFLVDFLTKLAQADNEFLKNKTGTWCCGCHKNVPVGRYPFWHRFARSLCSSCGSEYGKLLKAMGAVDD